MLLPCNTWRRKECVVPVCVHGKGKCSRSWMIPWFHLLKLSGFYVIHWMSSVNKAAELCFRNSRFCLSWEAGCSVWLWGKGGVAELGDSSLGGAGYLPAEKHFCSLPTADAGTLGNCCLVKASCTSDWEKYIHATFMERLKFTWCFSSGIGLDLVLGWWWWTLLTPLEEENLTWVLISSELPSA